MRSLGQILEVLGGFGGVSLAIGFVPLCELEELELQLVITGGARSVPRTRHCVPKCVLNRSLLLCFENYSCSGLFQAGHVSKL